MCVVEQ